MYYLYFLCIILLVALLDDEMVHVSSNLDAVSMDTDNSNADDAAHLETCCEWYMEEPSLVACHHQPRLLRKRPRKAS